MIATTQLSGVNSPFSLRFVAMISSSFLVLLGSVFLHCPDETQSLCRLTKSCGLRRKYLRTVTYQLRDPALLAMDNCQRAGTCLPAGTSLRVDLTPARVPRCRRLSKTRERERTFMRVLR